MIKYFYGSFIFTIVCLALGTAYGYFSGHTVEAALSALWICIVLGVLEISLSFDNTIVNATVMRDMDEKWQQRFTTWGILIAVFGMRVIFPIVIVAIAGHVGPIDAVRLAFNDPPHYAQILTGAHTGIMGFGGAFLMLVGLKFFFDSDKERHWFRPVESVLQRMASYEAIEIVVTLAALYFTSRMVETAEAHTFLVSGIFGLITFFAVEWLGNLLGGGEGAAVKRSGMALFIYLEVLDASFSFDGVIGAFALSNNLIIIALGLGIGAMFVRSLTIAFVKEGTLSQFRYLEHGAFWAILALAVIMFVSIFQDVPETVTGVVGAALIGLSFWTSVRYNKAHPHELATRGTDHG